MDVSVCAKHKQLAGQITTADTPDPRLQVCEGLWDKPQLPADKLDHCYTTTQESYRLAPSDHCLSHLIPAKRQACRKNRDKMDREMKNLQTHPDCTGWDVFRETSADLDERYCALVYQILWKQVKYNNNKVVHCRAKDKAYTGGDELKLTEGIKAAKETHAEMLKNRFSAHDAFSVWKEIVNYINDYRPLQP